MNKNQIRKEIASLINSIKEQSDTIADKPEVPQLELELILHKIEMLYQKSIVFNYVNSIAETPDEKPLVKEEKKAAPVTEAPKTEAVKTETPVLEKPKAEAPQKEIPKEEPPVVNQKTEAPKEEPKQETPKAEIAEEQPTEETKPEIKADEKPLEKPQEPKAEEVKKEAPEAEVKPEEKPQPKVEEQKPVTPVEQPVAPQAEKPKPEVKAEKKVEQSTIHKIQKPPIKDLRAAIGINDKFQFANELFAGQMPEYEIAIEQLNTVHTPESAVEYLGSLGQLYNWDPESETVKRLQDLVERRYTNY